MNDRVNPVKRVLWLLLPLVSAFTANAAGSDFPNIVYILCDDLGYGDVSCLNPDKGKIPTPHVDTLASQGMIFTDCHSGSSVCTPTRYGLLTGRYAWRTHLQKGVINTADANPLIAEDRLTVGALLKKHGYHTGIVGKWHLGMHFEGSENPSLEARPNSVGVPNGSFVTEGPITRGFDYFFGFEHARSIRTLIENDTVIDDIDSVEMLPRLKQAALSYIDAHTDEAKQGKPFFLYLSLSSPHTPIVPSDAWKGKSALGHPYADFVMQTDAVVGEVLDALDTKGLSDNTLVIFTSDNGCAEYIGAHDMEANGHFPSAQFRGYKGDIWDGGHRIPFIVRWPGKIKPGTQNDQLISLTDMIATCADMLGDALPDNAGEDSVSILPALLGTARTPLREAVVHHSSGGMFSIRKGNWKMAFGPGSGGFRNNPADTPPLQLFDLHNDIEEKHNRHTEKPDVAEELTKLLEKYVAEGRSTPGKPQKNDIKVHSFN